MEADFSGYASKAGLKCSDGRTIMPGAFQHQHDTQVPLVWQHGHDNPENVLGHAILEHRPDGVYVYGFFNDTGKAEHTKKLLAHKDIRMLSIWANQLVQKNMNVIHGVIREVSLVISGANPGAFIENVTLSHSDESGNEEFVTLEDEVIITSGEDIELLHSGDTPITNDPEKEDMKHAEEDETTTDGEETIEDVYNSFSDKQKDVVHYLIGEALQAAEGSDDSEGDTNDGEAKQSDDEEGLTMTNVFEKGSEKTADAPFISHADMQTIVADAKRSGLTLGQAIEGYALSHGITDIDILFPDAQNVMESPEWDSRRMEWVSSVLNGAHKTPFSNVRTRSADITADEARAKGYVKGDLKVEEFFKVSKRETTPTTIYKKQALDRDDLIDITDFDVVTWLKGEMRLMLDEELARCILMGDGRQSDHPDKVNEDRIRPIATDHELFTTKVQVNLDDASSTVQEIIDALVENRRFLKGSGMPTMYTTETYIAKFLLLKDTVGRRIYKNLEELAMELRVKEIVPVEAMEEMTNLVCVLVNMNDYNIGANKGGKVSMFDDFDIDYNKEKYLIETRVSGALIRLKSALAVWKVGSSLVVAVPQEPGFNVVTGVVTIPSVTGVVYAYSTAPSTPLTAGAKTAIADGASVTVLATPDTGYYFASSAGDSWTFTRDAS